VALQSSKCETFEGLGARRGHTKAQGSGFGDHESLGVAIKVTSASRRRR
jgi:hypothetical protein